MIEKELIYAGPMNKMMIRLKFFSLSTLIGSLVIAPIYLYQVKRHKPEASYKPHLFLVSGMLLGSLGSTFLFHRVARKYVLQMYRWTPPSGLQLPLDQERLRLMTIDFWGRMKPADVAVEDLVALNDGINTWKCASNGQTFYLSVPGSVQQNASSANGQVSALFPRAGVISSSSSDFVYSVDTHLRSKQLISQFK